METKNRKKIIKTRFFKTINKSLARFTTDELEINEMLTDTTKDLKTLP